MHMIPPAGVRAAGARRRLALTAALALPRACSRPAVRRARPPAAASVPAGQRRVEPRHAVGRGRVRVGCAGRPVPGMPGLATCQAASLRVTLDTSQAGGAAGSTYYPVDFINISGTPAECTASRACRSSPRTPRRAGRSARAAQRTRRSANWRPPGAGGVAHAWLQVARPATTRLRPASRIPRSGCRVYPPGEHRGRLRGPGLPGLRRDEHAAADRHAGPLRRG